MKIVVCDGPGTEAEKREWAKFTGVTVVAEDELGLIEMEEALEFLQASGNERCVVVPSGALTDSDRADFIDSWGARVQFQWFNGPHSPGEQDA